MPSEEYTAVSSGALKLKGVNSSSKIHKHKKRKHKRLELEPRAATEGTSKESSARKDSQIDARDGDDKQPSSEQLVENPVSEETSRPREGKTEAELRHEEIRRKRLNDRLKKEGTKTHKERVEELNRYLSNLSEHHDMPKIGPG